MCLIAFPNPDFKCIITAVPQENHDSYDNMLAVLLNLFLSTFPLSSLGIIKSCDITYLQENLPSNCLGGRTSACVYSSDAVF